MKSPVSEGLGASRKVHERHDDSQDYEEHEDTHVPAVSERCYYAVLKNVIDDAVEVSSGVKDGSCDHSQEE